MKKGKKLYEGKAKILYAGTDKVLPFNISKMMPLLSIIKKNQQLKVKEF